MKKNRITIKISKLNLFGYHGCYDYEKEKGQEFELEMEIKLILSLDDISCYHSRKTVLDDTIDYVEIESAIKKTFNSERHDLLETLAASISEVPYSISSKRNIDDRIDLVSVIIRKNNPLGMSSPYVEVKYINYNNPNLYNNDE